MFCGYSFLNRTFGFNYVKKLILVLIFLINYFLVLVSNLKIRLSFGLVLGNPILYLFGTRIKIRSNENVYNKQYYNHDENM